MFRAVTPIALALALVAQLLPVATPCHAHEDAGGIACHHRSHDDGDGLHDEHWAPPAGDEDPDRDLHDGPCRCPCHAPRAAVVTAEAPAPAATTVPQRPASQRCPAPGYLDTDRPPPRA